MKININSQYQLSKTMTMHDYNFTSILNLLTQQLRMQPAMERKESTYIGANVAVHECRPLLSMFTTTNNSVRKMGNWRMANCNNLATKLLLPTSSCLYCVNIKRYGVH